MKSQSIVTHFDTQHQGDRIASAMSAYQDAEKFLGHVKTALLRLEKVSAALLEQRDRGTLSHFGESKELWHELNNIHHQMLVFTDYHVHAAEQCFKEAEKVIDGLKALRPSEIERQS